ncbi:hypothetical protein [Patiriisocius marinus]|uniref:hypothetical protein n=1 Tax=Patiriisocius marinus TaxID=1397112 RepID=UPI00232C5A98|nr:hypothetical protein [Patiriisocius marinus]
MKKIIQLFCFVALSFSTSAQVGIGTTTPEGMLDINSSTMGFVYPTAALTSTINQNPVQNPQGGALAIGTTIFNTNLTGTGLNDVEPGIYSWDGTKWVTHFYKKESTLFIQSTGLRTSSLGVPENVPGLGVLDGNTFIPSYTGTYKIEMRGYFGAGEVKTNRGMHTVVGKGDYNLNFNGTVYSATTKSFSSYHPSATDYTNAMKETTIIKFVNLVAGVSYPFSLTFLQTTTTSGRGFRNNALSGRGRGYLGTEVPCSIEFTYLER